MSQRKSKLWKYKAPGKSFEQYKKDNPFKGVNETTSTTKVVPGDTPVPFGPGRPGYGGV